MNERKKTNRIGLFSFKIETNDNDSDTAAKTKDAGASSLTLAVVVYPFRHSCFHFHYISVWFSLNSTLKILCVYAHIVHSAAQHTYIYVLKCNYFCSNWCTIHQLLRPRRFSFRKLFPCCHSWQFRFTATLLSCHCCFIRASQTIHSLVSFNFKHSFVILLESFFRFLFGPLLLLICSTIFVLKNGYVHKQSRALSFRFVCSECLRIHARECVWERETLRFGF